MEANFLHNTVFLFVPSCPAGTQWPRSNGCSASLSQTSHSRLLSDARLRVLAEARGHQRTHSSCRDANQGGNRKPAQGETVPANSNVRVHGAAWTSDGRNHKGRAQHRWRIHVEQRQICLVNQTKRLAILGIQLENANRTGKTDSVARATDSLGQTQPVQRDPDRGTST